jgi:hypothetical protein
MNKLSILFCVLILGFFSSCEKESNNSTNNNSVILGNWINPSYNDSLIIFDKSSNLKNNDYGIAFNDNGLLVERKNSGWCATPPIAYSDFNGTWTIKDSVIQISVDYWGGKADYIWKLVSIDNNKLKIIRRLEKYNQTEN